MISQTKFITMRHEEKYICSETYLRMLESRLNAVMSRDENQGEEGYEIKSLYFDTISDRMYEESLAGLEQRNKYRIRIYNENANVIKLEKKTSIRNLKKKKSELIEKDYVDKLLAGEETGHVLDYENGSLKQEFTMLQKTELLRPKAIICYHRKAYVNEIGNIRITLDRDIRVTDYVDGFWDADGVYLPVLPSGLNLLEVKYDGILPGYLVRMINFKSLERTSFSKYGLGREVLMNSGRMSG